MSNWGNLTACPLRESIWSIISAPISEPLSCLQLQVGSVTDWVWSQEYDLITCVHGLHYVGDKLGILQAVAAHLSPSGYFAAHLDLQNLKTPTGASLASALGKQFRRQGLCYHRRWRLLSWSGRRVVEFPYRYLGADDTAGPNFTGQPAVDSYYTARGHV